MTGGVSTMVASVIVPVPHIRSIAQSSIPKVAKADLYAQIRPGDLLCCSGKRGHLARQTSTTGLKKSAVDQREPGIHFREDLGFGNVPPREHDVAVVVVDIVGQDAHMHTAVDRGLSVSHCLVHGPGTHAI